MSDKLQSTMHGIPDVIPFNNLFDNNFSILDMDGVLHERIFLTASFLLLTPPFDDREEHTHTHTQLLPLQQHDLAVKAISLAQGMAYMGGLGSSFPSFLAGVRFLHQMLVITKLSRTPLLWVPGNLSMYIFVHC